MSRSLFLINGNICGAKIRLGRAMQKPPMTQDDLAKKIQGHDPVDHFAH